MTCFIVSPDVRSTDSRPALHTIQSSFRQKDTREGVFSFCSLVIPDGNFVLLSNMTDQGGGCGGGGVLLGDDFCAHFVISFSVYFWVFLCLSFVFLSCLEFFFAMVTQYDVLFI